MSLSLDLFRERKRPTLTVQRGGVDTTSAVKAATELCANVPAPALRELEPDAEGECNAAPRPAAAARILNSMHLAPAIVDAPADDTRTVDKKRPRRGPAEQPVAAVTTKVRRVEGMALPALSNEDKNALSMLAAFVDAQDPKGNAVQRFALKERLQSCTSRRFDLNQLWRALVAEGRHGTDGQNAANVMYNYINKELYKVHKSIVMVSRKMGCVEGWSNGGSIGGDVSCDVYTPPEYPDHYGVPS